MSADKVTLQTLLGSYPNTQALKTGAIRSDLVDFAFADIKVANTGFKPLVREGRFDAGELAIVTFLQAKRYNKPYVLLPAVVVGRGQLHTIAYNGERGTLGPRDLAGKRVGLRAWTVTTSTWVRGILIDDYGLDVSKVHWVTFEDPHLAEFHDPDFVERAAPGKTMVDMLLSGELDAAIVGDHLPDPRLKYLVPAVEAVSRRWAETHGGVPINHMFVMRKSLVEGRPDVVREVFRLLAESKKAANLPASGTPLDPLRFGVEANRRSLEIIIDFAFRQGLLDRRFSVDELLDDTTRALGA